MKLLVASIPHSGTMFTMHLLPLPSQVMEDEPQENTKRFIHLGGNASRLRYLQSQCFTIIPMRHPVALARSWHKRGMFVEQLHDLWWQVRDQHGFLFPVDSPRRDEYLAALARTLDLPLQTDWATLNHMPGESDLDYEIPSDIQQFVERYW